jgi:uncharacterized protein
MGMSTPMHRVLPVSVDPRKCALKGECLAGCVEQSNLPQLCTSVSAVLAPALAKLRFNLDDSGGCIVKGSVSSLVEVVCQRCLDPIELCLRAELALQVVSSEDRIDHLPSGYDPWLVTERVANLYELFEEELLLTLPIVSYHELGHCTGNAFVKRHTDDTPNVASSGPFNILKQLKEQ